MRQADSVGGSGESSRRREARNALPMRPVAASMASASTIYVEDDDEVVEELDVYISKALADQLYLLQFPHQSTEREYADEQCVGVRVKPKQKKVALEYALDTDDPSYDRARAEQFSENANSGDDNLTGCKDGTQAASSNVMDREILTSTRLPGTAENCAIGILRQGELHLTPLHALLQMRPGFQHLDQSGERSFASHAATDDDGEEVAPKLVTMRFAQGETGRAKKAREKFRFMQRQEESEPWVEANFHGLETEMSRVERSKLFCPQMDRDMSDIPGTLAEYLQRVVTDKKESSDTDKVNPKKTGSPQVSSLHALNNLPLQDRIKAILARAKVVNLAKLMTLLPPQGDMFAVLRELQRVALLVRGCWVVKSEVLYPKDTFSPNTGVPAEIICRARDFLLYLFTQSRHVSQAKFARAVNLPGEDIKTLLSDVAKPTPEGWEFLLPCDTDFITKFPEVAQRQQLCWGAKQANLSKYFKLPRQDSHDAVMQSAAAGGAKARQVRRRPRSRHDSTASERSGSATNKTPGAKTSKAARPSTSSGRTGGHH
ncbi:DNA-directed RNA polymerase III subunit RPC5-like [Haemaphysalis longicornis]